MPRRDAAGWFFMFDPDRLLTLMVPFDDLTPTGRTRRLATLARSVLMRHHGMTNVKLRHVSTHSFNTVFRVDSPDVRAALRVGGQFRIHPAGVEAIEADWLTAIGAAGIAAPQNLAAIDGSPSISAPAPGVPGQRVCTLFSWVDGVDLRTRLSPETLTAAGTLLAKLHDIAAGMKDLPPTEVHATTAMALPGVDLVSTHRHKDRALFVEALERVQRATDALWASGVPHLLHGDFGPHNILAMRAELRPIDFQDLRYGLAVQDLGLTIADLGRRDPDLIDPFVEGYRRQRELPPFDQPLLDTLAAARSLTMMNLALFAPNTPFAAAFEPHGARVRAWMLTSS